MSGGPIQVEEIEVHTTKLYKFIEEQKHLFFRRNACVHNNFGLIEWKQLSERRRIYFKGFFPIQSRSWLEEF